MLDGKDVANIKKSFGLVDVQRHGNDQESVRAWINEWENNENNPILFYKFQGEDAPDGLDLLKEDFMIIVQSPLQKTMAQKFACKGIAIDSTHGTTGYDFPLTTIMVIDEYGQGFQLHGVFLIMKILRICVFSL